MVTSSSPQQSAVIRWTDMLLCITFLAILALPLTLFGLGLPEPVSIEENRSLAQAPDLRHAPLQSWPKLLAPYLYDHMPFRTQCVVAYMYIWERCLHSPVNDRVIGKDGERFIAVEDYLGLHPLFKDQQILMRLAIAGTNAWFHAHNIPYIFIPLPDKSTFYHGNLPFWTTWKKGKSRYDQFVDCIPKSDVETIDMFEELKRHADGKRLYDISHDLYHWNANALSIAYKAIDSRLHNISNNLNPQTISSEYSVFPFTTSKAIGFYNTAYGHQQIPYIRLHDIQRLKNITSELPSLPVSTEIWKNPLLIENASCPSGALWLLCDSYFMATHCEEHPQWIGCVIPEAFQVHTFFRDHYRLFSTESFQKLLTAVPPVAVVEAMTQWVGAEALLYRSTDPLIRILGDQALHTPGYVLDPDYPFNAIETQNVELSRRPGAVIADCAAGASLLLPANRTDDDGRLVVMAALEAPADGTLLVRHATKGLSLDTAPVTTFALQKGPNLVHLQVLGKPRQWLDLRLELPPGTWRFIPIPTDFIAHRPPVGRDAPSAPAAVP